MWGQLGIDKKYFSEFREEADNTQVYKAAVVYLDSVFKVWVLGISSKAIPSLRGHV